VISREARKRFIPDSSDCGLQKKKDEMGQPEKRFSSARCGCSSYRWLTFKHDNSVGKVCRHDKIMFDYEGSFLCVKDETGKMFVYTVIRINKIIGPTYRLMTLLAMIRCSESRELENGR